jgi:hypothetical protein
VLLLLQPAASNSSVASFLADRGEGIMGVSLEVGDLAQARKAVQVGPAPQLVPYPGVYGASILIRGTEAHGLWIECYQRRSQDDPQ